MRCKQHLGESVRVRYYITQLWSDEDMGIESQFRTPETNQPMPKDAIFIDKSIQEGPSLDFKKLLDDGIADVQHMAGENWTDYNVHDPGVTILEQLCYALTESGLPRQFCL